VKEADRIAAERQAWLEMRDLANADDVAGFFEKYSQYLERNGVISGPRQLIHKMAKQAAEELKVKK
jgi:hypothetical protein